MTGIGFYDEVQGFGVWMYAVSALMILIALSVGSLKMKTTVAPDAVTVRFGFLNTTRIPIGEIARAEAIAYRPVRDYGGWGIRGFGNRRALNVRGDRGVLIVRTNGSTLMIGSQRPRELLSALARAGVATEDKLPADVREF
ncbi:MAG: hypothetical protein M3S32_01285 [Acidobacteriota bacterium]|nr:hypothetical protein [Acidobacteriota bacterium]